MSATLENFRRQIDALDDQIIQLLKDRLHVVRQVADFKRSTTPHHFPIRAGREARMLRRIAESFRGTDFAPAAAAQLWRIIIGTSTALEGTLSISVFAPEEDGDLLWLTREYFGPAAIIGKQPHIKRVIGDVMDGKAAIGIIPSFADNHQDDGWQHLVRAQADMPKIFAHLPFVYTRENPEQFPAALAFARIQPEDSGDDRSLCALEVAHDMSQHRLQTALGKVQLNAQWLSVASPSPDVRWHLVELQGFIAPDNPALAACMASLGDAAKAVHYLGAYAAPFTIQDHP